MSGIFLQLFLCAFYPALPVCLDVVHEIMACHLLNCSCGSHLLSMSIFPSHMLQGFRPESTNAILRSNSEAVNSVL